MDGNTGGDKEATGGLRLWVEASAISTESMALVPPRRGADGAPLRRWLQLLDGRLHWLCWVVDKGVMEVPPSAPSTRANSAKHQRNALEFCQ